MNKISNKNLKKIAILGASRGLGLAIGKHFAHQNSETKLFLSSRKIISKLKQLACEEFFKLEPSHITNFACDFANPENISPLLIELIKFQPQQIIYAAGGGPFGFFQAKKWQDHQWAFNVNLLFPAELLHQVLNALPNFSELSQIVFVGSAIAENSPDPQSASYATAKHGLRGLITSIQKENPPLDIRLFSPGYIDTPLLPPQAWPRQSQNKIYTPENLAQILYNWCNDVQFKNQHLELPPFVK